MRFVSSSLRVEPALAVEEEEEEATMTELHRRTEEGFSGGERGLELIEKEEL